MKKILLALLLASPASAGGLAVGEQNAVSAATGGAGAGRDDDAGAAWHDPAALADGGGWRVGLSLALARPALEARSTDDTWTTDSEGAWSTPPHLDASFARDRWAAGIALGVPFGGGVTWPAMWPGATQAVETQLMVLRAAPFVAWSFGRLRVSAGVHVDAGRLQIKRNLDFIDTQGDVRMDLTGRGLGADAALYYAPSADAGIGLVYRSQTTLDFEGPANFTAPAAFSEKTPDQTARTSMTMPDTLVLGAHYRHRAITVLADVEWANWSVNDKTDVAFADASTPEAIQTNAWHDTISVRGGVEYTRAKLVARGGAYLDPSPVPGDHLTPTSPDATRLGLTAGASYQVSSAWTADLFAERMWLLRRETTSTDTMPATYGGTAIVVGAGVRWTR